MKKTLLFLFAISLALLGLAQEATLIKSPFPVVVKEAGQTYDLTNIYNQQLVALEWSDLQHWNSWTKLNDYKEIKPNLETWQIYPTQKYEVTITDPLNAPCPNIDVQLTNHSKQVLWQGKTDAHGKVILLSGLNKERIESGYIVAQNKKLPLKANQTNYDIQLANPAEKPDSVLDVMFVVDATGSMSGQINFFKKELDIIVKQIEANSVYLKVRVGLLFYRDNGDQYLTRPFDFSTEMDTILTSLSAQSADGGGDTEEAVEVALAEALTMSWTPQSLSRIIVLVLDAAPHRTPAINKSLAQSIAEAAKRGIKICPVATQSIAEDGQLLLRSMAIATNGHYIHCYNGNPGQTNVTQVSNVYPVEPLNDLLIRIIVESLNI